MISAANKPDILFIMGITPRSGTHFLANLICQHPDCRKSVIAEDGLLSSSSSLDNYINVSYKEWENNVDDRAKAKKLLFKSLGIGLKEFLIAMRIEHLSSKKLNYDDSVFNSRYLVTKTPQNNIINFFDYFPDNKLLIIVRDGRSVVESQYLSFNKTFYRSAKNWAWSAEKIIRFNREWHGTDKQYLIIKYEELYTHTEQQMRKILAFLNLDESKYNFEAAIDMPVTGSSSFKRGNGAVHWMPVSKNKEFDPLNRAANWTRQQHERFNWIAQKQMLQFGYELKVFDDNKLYWAGLNQLMDLRLYIKTIYLKVQGRFKLFFGIL